MDTQLVSLNVVTSPNGNVGSLTKTNGVSCVQSSSVPLSSCEATLGRYLARRLVQIGVSDVFSVPGDFNLTLLDHLIAEPGLNLIGCCNELNAGYAADGYARSRGVGSCVVTFTVGGLSVLNAIAGAYSENLSLICIVGGPNSNDYGTNRIIHHTIGVSDFNQELRCFQTVTCYQVVVNNLEDAHEQIDTAISTALKESKPVYISIGCNLAAIPHPSFSREPIPFSLSPKLSNKMGLEAAVEVAVEFLNKAVKPVMVGGPKLRAAQASEAFVEFADASGYALAVMPSGKGLVPDHHPHFIGTYWGAVSTAFCAEIVESADAYIFAGPIFNDYSSIGYSLLLKKEKALIVLPDRVMNGNGPTFGYIRMKDFLQALAKRIKNNTTAYENYHRIFKMLSGDTVVIAETGDSWFNCKKLKLPEGCRYEFQMQYGSIGWYVGATLGYAQAANNKRVISCIGDGSFQELHNNKSAVATINALDQALFPIRNVLGSMSPRFESWAELANWNTEHKHCKKKMVKPTAAATTKDDAQALFKSLRSAYSATPTNLKIIDLYVAFAVFTAVIQEIGKR
ncbi:thiamine pyrophosphate (TPP)-dependent enzyme [Artemisia annua]|uniref:pyruvate decarboxylase n=1 Tax=Artemisia annua TaxID=35608 RepID=A0A2U1L3F6_ARTAN|nr:thiamine pyrophosphate (TPP)-dependent enzyme [Artemisia annua]